MGWPFGGVWEGRSVQDLKEILSALAIAINQREAAMDLTLTPFEYGESEATKTYPDPEDYDGFPLARMGVLFEQFDDGISNIAEDTLRTTQFVQYDALDIPASFNDRWTKASLLADVDLGSSIVGEEPITSTVRLNRLKGILDRLIYLRSSLSFLGLTSSTTKGASTQSDIESNWPDAWAGRESNSFEEQGQIVWFSHVELPSGRLKVARIQQGASGTGLINYTGGGTKLAGYLSFRIVATALPSPVSNDLIEYIEDRFEVDCNGAVFAANDYDVRGDLESNVPPGYNSRVYSFYDDGSMFEVSGADVDMDSYWTSDISDLPPHGTVGDQDFEASIASLSILGIVDISSELTDQAP